MAYTYTPMYYSSFQDTITSLCMSILPFSSKNRRLPADDKLARCHTDNLKWQQNSFHRILNLIGLHREGIVSEAEVSSFRSQLLQTLISSPADQELPNVTRDKLLFLQDLLCAKCISEDEYHISKTPLLQRLAAQGVEINSRGVIGGAPQLLKNSEEEWSDIDLNDGEPPEVVEKCKEKTPLKLLWRGRVKKAELSSNEKEEATLPPIAATKSGKHKRKPFHALFQREKHNEGSECKSISKQRVEKSSKKNWGFEGLKKWKRSSCEDELVKPYLPTGERSDDYLPSNLCKLVASPIDEGPDTKRIKKKLHSDGSSSDFFVDEELGENIKKELSRIQSELLETNPNLNFSKDQFEEISMKLPLDKADLNKFFPKSWCNTYGEIVLDVVKEFKDHVGEMENLRSASKNKQNDFDNNWVAFEDDVENFHPNLFTQAQLSSNPLVNNTKGGNDDNMYNPFM